MIIQLCPGTYHIFSLRAGSLGACRQSPGTPALAVRGGGGQGRKKRPGTQNPAALLHATGLLHPESEGQSAWRPGGGGGGLGETGSGERAVTRLRCCPSPGGRSTEPDKPQAVLRSGRAGGYRIRRPHNWSWSTHRGSAHLPDCGAASSRASALTASLLVNVAAGTASLADVGPTAPCSALRSCPRLSLAGLSSGWPLLGYRALGLRGGLDQGPWWDSTWHGPPRRGRPLLAASFWKKAPLNHPPLARRFSRKSCRAGSRGWGLRKVFYEAPLEYLPLSGRRLCPECGRAVRAGGGYGAQGSCWRGHRPHGCGAGAEELL